MSAIFNAHIDNFDVGNLRAFASDGGVDYYTTLTNWLDPGEQALIEAASGQLRQPCVLDIGVGAGRTAPLMRSFAGGYTAIDMSARMIEATLRRYPDIDARVMDARALEFPDAAFDLVAFSYNGLDAMPPPERRRALAEIARVTRVGGLFAFSSLNRNGPGFNERFSLTRPRPGRPRVAEALRVAAKGVVGYRSYRRNRRFWTTDPHLAASASSAHNFAVVLMFTSLTAQDAALGQLGFVVEQAFSDQDGARVALNRDDIRSVWLHYLARRHAA